MRLSCRLTSGMSCRTKWRRTCSSSCKDGATLACQLHPTVRRQRDDRNAMKFDHVSATSSYTGGDHRPFCQRRDNNFAGPHARVRALAYRCLDSIERRSSFKASILASWIRQSEKPTNRTPNASKTNELGSPPESTPYAPRNSCAAPKTAMRTSVQRGDWPDAAFQSLSCFDKAPPTSAASRSASLLISCSRILSTPSDF
jgi:hypothetical protein